MLGEEWIRRAIQCGKQGFDSAAEAIEVARRVTRRGRKIDKKRKAAAGPGVKAKISVYRCEGCGRYHWSNDFSLK